MTYRQVRRITANYPGTCAKCRNTFPAGTVVYWNKQAHKSFHVACFEGHTQEQTPSEIDTVTDTSKRNIGFTHTIEYAELKRNVLSAIGGDYSFVTRQRNRDVMKRYAEDYWKVGASFCGFDSEQFSSWLKHGYKTEILSNLIPESPPIRKKRRVIFQDEGELQIDLALSGFDNPFIAWTKREAVPGLAVNVEYSFVSSTPARLIEEYETWLAKALYSLETEGIDLEVSVFNDSRGLCKVNSRSVIRVKREMQATDFASWSVMFSPAGWRGMFFTELILTADARGDDTDMGLGHGPPNPNPWNVVFSPESRTLEIQCPYSPQDFPAQAMSDKLRAVVRQFH